MDEDLLILSAYVTGVEGEDLRRGAEKLEDAANDFARKNATDKVVECRILAARAYLRLDIDRARRLLKPLRLIGTHSQLVEVEKLLRQCSPTIWERLMSDND